MRGNHLYLYLYLSCHQGLSPRMRGNLALIAASAAGIGVYPRACGGTYAKWDEDDPEEGLSPRMRGNRVAYRPRFEGEVKGLSPRMRGNHEPGRLLREDGGSIPAHAGEPIPVGRPVQLHRIGSIPAHAGEPGLTQLTARVIMGSIPAHAGEPCLGVTDDLKEARVYPRACGGTRKQRA